MDQLRFPIPDIPEDLQRDDDDEDEDDEDDDDDDDNNEEGDEFEATQIQYSQEIKLPPIDFSFFDGIQDSLDQSVSTAASTPAHLTPGHLTSNSTPTPISVPVSNPLSNPMSNPSVKPSSNPTQQAPAETPPTAAANVVPKYSSTKQTTDRHPHAGGKKMLSAAQLEKSGKAGKLRSATRGGGKVALQTVKKKKKRTETFALYIYKVLKQVHPETGISKKSMVIMNSFILDMFDKLATESIRLVNLQKKRTLSSREIQTAVRLLLPGELSKHAVCEGAKAVSKFTQ